MRFIDVRFPNTSASINPGSTLVKVALPEGQRYNRSTVTEVTLQMGDITEFEVDAVVSPANNDLILGGGVSGAVRRVAGAEIQEACNKVAPIPLGEAVVTPGFSLKSKLVIHAAVMPLGLWADAGSVRRAVANSLKRAEEKGVKSLAIPAVGTGAGNFPAHKSARILFEELTRHLKNSKLEKVLVVLFDEKVMREYTEIYNEFKGTLTESADPGTTG
jgi:O-acetyl-ADP-ribose deacetylase (regulator of RNase III)